jgi:transposase
LCDLLGEMEIEASLSHPLKTKTIASARIKTDKIDAATLTPLLRTGVKNRVHALLAKHNLVYSAGGLFTAKGREWLASLPLAPIVRSVLEGMLTLVEVLDLLVKQASAQVTVRAQDDQAARLLCTIPGIGYYSALLIAAEIDGVERCPDARRLARMPGWCHRCGSRVVTLAWNMSPSKARRGCAGFWSRPVRRQQVAATSWVSTTAMSSGAKATALPRSQPLASC